MQLPDRSESLWLATAPAPLYPTLDRDLEVDVAIVGAGITGLVAAWRLARMGRRVAVLEQARIAGGETGHTTAHLTALVDTRYRQIERDFGREGARLVAKSNMDAIEWIERTAGALGIDAGFSRVPGYLYSERNSDIGRIRRETEAARRAGLDAHATRQVPLPFRTAGGMRLEHQAQFHPRTFLLPLAERIQRKGGLIFEQTHVTSVADGEPCRVETNRGMVTARDVIVATDVPLNWAALITKLPAYRTYAIAVQLEDPLPAGLFWDTDDPYHYTRTQRTSEGEFVIIGGEDHKVGTETETTACFDRLEAYARERFHLSRVAYRWSGQVLEPIDGLPYIGLNTGAHHVYVSTGYSGNGMSWGTVGGLVTSDMVLGRHTPYVQLYKATRIKPLAGAYDFVRENLDFPKYLASDRLTNADAEGTDPSAVPAGGGRILAIEGRKYAVYRDPQGTLHTLSPICTHMHCDVAWNAAETSWDCPCHGSRFSPDGDVLHGPAVKPLAKADLPHAMRAR
jgi:glycine/D-amino acid oxidase-like deaminating enzyme/nitrite reductase/ring-hydroxylating ferredoxin subunit